ncbi:uncharacterized protein MONOS_14878 [Monocercomonoides exilis]|uniref:uncharacterized protein n=1 Tax=Monocercomonoides exilis TaxID=2049356 RepID=UPI003559E3D7|nr:hypothetical protein MONOS_14878 [Monocercomonoides exilis]
MQHLISSSYQNAHDATVASALFSDANASMKEDSDDVTKDEIRETPITHMFTKLFYELEDCPEIEQKVKILEMNEMVDKMDEEEFRQVFTVELFNRIDQMIEEKKLSFEKSAVLLKHAGCIKKLKCFFLYSFDESLLVKRIREMIIDENENMEEKNEKLFIDSCECYITQSFLYLFSLLQICVPCLLKVALKKEEGEEAQKEVEMALLALSCINDNDFVEQRLYLNEIREIIQYHQECRNLSHLAYQSAWKFLMGRFYESKSLEGLIVNELHFVREARRELEELMICVDLKRNEKELGKTIEYNMMKRWMDTIKTYFSRISDIKNEEECAGLAVSVVGIYEAAKFGKNLICGKCVHFFNSMARPYVWKSEKIDVFVKSGAVECALDYVHRQTLEDDSVIYVCFAIFSQFCNRLESAEYKNFDNSKWKFKRKILGKMEEEGYEDCIVGLIYWIKGSFLSEMFNLNLKNYLVCY